MTAVASKIDGVDVAQARWTYRLVFWVMNTEHETPGWWLLRVPQVATPPCQKNSCNFWYLARRPRSNIQPDPKPNPNHSRGSRSVAEVARPRRLYRWLFYNKKTRPAERPASTHQTDQSDGGVFFRTCCCNFFLEPYQPTPIKRWKPTWVRTYMYIYDTRII